MRAGITMRIILGLNVLVVAIALVLGYLASGIAADAVEQRLVHEVARNTASFLEEESYPLSDTLMRKLKRMFGLDFVAIEEVGGKVLGSTVEADLARRVVDRAFRREGGRLEWGQEALQFAAEPVTRQSPTGGETYRWRLIALAGAEQFEQASRRASSRVGLVALLAAGGATVLAVGLSWTIARPIRRLAREMDLLARTPGDLHPDRGPRKGPREVVQLRNSFVHLLDQLETARTQLARSQQLAVLGKLSASVAHELRNPLSGVKMHLRLLADEGGLSQAQSQSLETIEREAGRMELYLNDLMELAGEAGRDPGRPREEEPGASCNVEQVVESVLTLMCPRLDHAGIEVRADVSACLPPARLAPGRLRQVLLNLLVNAAEAMESGGRLTIDASETPDRQIQLCVADTGPGVRDEQVETIFEPFHSTKPNSAGLGLYICRRIVAGAGGRLLARSDVSGGRFDLLLPPAGEEADDVRHA
jgi:signal transduction histidine kinase